MPAGTDPRVLKWLFSQLLASMRAGLRNRLERSILMDGAGFTRQLEELYRQMWRARAPATS